VQCVLLLASDDNADRGSRGGRDVGGKASDAVNVELDSLFGYRSSHGSSSKQAIVRIIIGHSLFALGIGRGHGKAYACGHGVMVVGGRVAETEPRLRFFINERLGKAVEEPDLYNSFFPCSSIARSTT